MSEHKGALEEEGRGWHWAFHDSEGRERQIRPTLVVVVVGGGRHCEVQKRFKNPRRQKAGTHELKRAVYDALGTGKKGQSDVLLSLLVIETECNAA